MENRDGMGTVIGSDDASARGQALGSALVPLSVLDLATVGAGSTAREALRTSVQLARFADSRGFTRYWVAEHHSAPGVSSSSPAVILGNLACCTNRVRLGSGGVMLPNHLPLLIAEQFGTLEALAPGRIDLGVGRGPGADATTATVLRADRRQGGVDEFPRQLADLVHFLDDDFPEGHPYQRVHAVPGPAQGKVPGGVQSADRPPIWLLGSSESSARMAGSMGLPFAFAHHFSPTDTESALDLYRQCFRPSPKLNQPYAMISVATFAAEEETEARRQVTTGVLAMLQVRKLKSGLVPTSDDAEAYPYRNWERDFVEKSMASIIFGTVDQVCDGLDNLVKRTGVDELMLTANAHSNAALLRSYEIIADAYGLPESESTSSLAK